MICSLGEAKSRTINYWLRHVVDKLMHATCIVPSGLGAQVSRLKATSIDSKRMLIMITGG